MSPKRIIFLTPTIFGLAHVHHFYEFHISHPHHPFVAKIARTVLQFSYTTLFGAFVTFIYLRSGSLLACIVVHSFCNWIGLPRFWGRLEGVTPLIGPPMSAQDKDRQRKNCAENRDNGQIQQMSVIWTVVYYILSVIGAVWFWKMLWVLTKSPAALIDLEK